VGGGRDAFVARVIAELTGFEEATFLGGSGDDVARGLAIAPTTGDVFVVGGTESLNFPGTNGGARSALGGDADGFVARLNASLTSLNQATYLGGSGGGNESALALAISPATGNVYVAGATTSTDFPGTSGGAQSASGNASAGGGQDAFVARLNAGPTTLGQATYLRGIASDDALGLAIAPTTGDVYVAGRTDSTNFPGTRGGAQSALAGLRAAFVARLNAS